MKEAPSQAGEGIQVLAVVVWSILLFTSIACQCLWAVIACSIVFPFVCLFATSVGVDDADVTKEAKLDGREDRSLWACILGVFFGAQFFDDDE